MFFVKLGLLILMVCVYLYAAFVDALGDKELASQIGGIAGFLAFILLVLALFF